MENKRQSSLLNCRRAHYYNQEFIATSISQDQGRDVSMKYQLVYIIFTEHASHHEYSRFNGGQWLRVLCIIVKSKVCDTMLNVVNKLC